MGKRFSEMNFTSQKKKVTQQGITVIRPNPELAPSDSQSNGSGFIILPMNKMPPDFL